MTRWCIQIRPKQKYSFKQINATTRRHWMSHGNRQRKFSIEQAKSKCWKIKFTIHESLHLVFRVEISQLKLMMLVSQIGGYSNCQHAMETFWIRIFFLVEIFGSTLCAKILVIPLPYNSHMLSTNAIGQQLKTNGHEVSFSRI